MGSLLWQLVDRSAETEFIFALFHLLLAGLGLLILLRWLGRRSQQLNPPALRLLTIAFSLFALDFAMTATYYGMVFFFDRQWNPLLFTWLSRALASCAMMLSAAGLLASVREDWSSRVTGYAIGGCSTITCLLLLDFGLPHSLIRGIAFHPLATEAADVLATSAVAGAMILLVGQGQKWSEPALLTMFFLLSSGLVHLLHPFLDAAWSGLWWHVEEHLLSFSLVTFAWALGEHSAN